MKKVSWVSISLAGALLMTSALADDNGQRGSNNNNNNNGQNNQNSFSSSVVGSTPGTMIGGVASGGAPWMVNQGSASLSSNGQLQVDVQGLLLAPGAPPNLVGTVGPVQAVAASVICGGSGGMVAANTNGVFLDASGRASIQSSVLLPATCIAPAVIVRIFNLSGPIGGQLGAFIASTGFAPASNFPFNFNQNQNQNQNQNNDHDR